MYIPEKLRTSVLNRWGDEGQQWLDNLPNVAEKCCTNFGVKLGKPYEIAYANFVTEVQASDGTSAVLKIGFPNSEAVHEQHVLCALSGKSCVEVLKQDESHTAILLEKIEPGHDLETVTDDEEATTIAAKVMRDLPGDAPSNYEFPTVTRWLNVFKRIGTDHSIPKELLEHAVLVHTTLDEQYSERKLLHGDLHHNNILFDAERGWVAIDPQGVIGDPVCEVGQYFHNPHGIQDKPDLENVLLKRAEIFADILQCDLERVLGRAFVQCAISCAWSVEDNDDGWEEYPKDSEHIGKATTYLITNIHLVEFAHFDTILDSITRTRPGVGAPETITLFFYVYMSERMRHDEQTDELPIITFCDGPVCSSKNAKVYRQIIGNNENSNGPTEVIVNGKRVLVCKLKGCLHKHGKCGVARMQEAPGAAKQTVQVESVKSIEDALEEVETEQRG